MAINIENRITRLRIEGLQNEQPTMEVEKQSFFVDGETETPGPFSYARDGEHLDDDLEAAIHEALDLLPDRFQAMILSWAGTQ
jgi:hypothetical protein